MPTTPKHEIEIQIDETGQITAQVNGVTGPACSDISKWLNSLGEVVEDKPTADYYKRPTQQGIKVGK